MPKLITLLDCLPDEVNERSVYLVSVFPVGLDKVSYLKPDVAYDRVANSVYGVLNVFFHRTSLYRQGITFGFVLSIVAQENVWHNADMYILSIVIGWMSKALEFAVRNRWLVAVVLLSLLVVILWVRKDKPINVEIKDKTETLNQIQDKKDAEIGENFNTIDAIRDRDNQVIKNTQTKPSRNGNVTANQLERILNDQR